MREIYSKLPEKKVHIYESTARARIEMSTARLVRGLSPILIHGKRLGLRRE